MTELTIAGCGAAGSFLALRALQLGLEPTLLRLPVAAVTGIEIIPASTGRLLEVLGLGSLLGSLGVGLGSGLSRRWSDGTSDVAEGHALHVNRLRLREALLAEARRRGARIRDVERLPAPDLAAYAVDATGQRAAWSRPVVRRGRQAADLFAAEGVVASGTGRLAMLDRGWAYLAADQTTCTVGVIGRPSGAPPVLDGATRQALDLALDAPFRFVGRRPAFVQWAAKPITGRRVAVGDAAFHHDPIGGRGLAFALGSAFAAAATLATWRDDPGAESLGQAYYEGYVASERRRHLAFLGGEAVVPGAPADLPEQLRWIAPATTGPLAVNGRVVAGEAFEAAGLPLRWAGGLDLATLRDLTIETRPRAWVADRLVEHGLTAGEARHALSWAFAQGLVGPGTPDGGRPRPGLQDRLGEY